LCISITGCTAKIDRIGGSEAAPAAEPQGDDDKNVTNPDEPGTVDWEADGNVEPGPTFLRRLTNDEYNDTLRDLLGETETVDRAALFDFVPDSRVHGFASNAENVSMSSAVLERYRDAAESISESVSGDEDVRARVLGCDPESEGAACVAGFAERFARAAYRRELEADEKKELESLADQDDLLDGVKLVIERVLLSPNFLFRIEEGVEDPARPDLMRLNGYEMATRLSYLLLGTTPSVALLDRAADGALDSADGVAQTAREMLADPRAKTAVRRFYDQWLRLDRLPELERDATLFPDFDAELTASMREETTRLLDSYIWEPAKNFLDVVSAPSTFMNQKLADFYGAPAVEGWQLVSYPEGSGRKGLLGHASLLALSSRADRASIILRGKYVREALLCTTMPPVPSTVPKLPDPDPNQSEADRLAQHSSDPSCAGCHNLMDPLGTGLSNFDAIGKFTQIDPQGFPVTTAGAIHGFSDLEDPSFDGEVELADKLRALPALPQCVVTQLFRHAFARQERTGDSALFGSVLEPFAASGYDLKELLVAFVTSDAFRYRERTIDQGDWE
jgi:hypothetical protein